MRRTLALLSALLLAVAAAACGDDDGVATTGTTVPDTTTTTTEPPPTTAPGDDELPGERIDLFPNEGAELAVMGVAADDTLNLRSGPGVDFDVVLELDPLAVGIVATGHNRSLDDEGIWAEVTAEGATGWASTAFLTHLGPTDDITTQLYPDVADRPSAETMVELGQIVAGEVASEDPPSTITVVDGPTVGDLGEITVDVVGLGDDSGGGYRLAIFAEPDPSGEGFTVRTVEATVFCIRGVSGELCL